jgi:hypothetical protein
MRRIRSVFAIAAAVVAAMAFAGPAFASTDSGCISIPFSPLMTFGAPVTFTALLLQLVVAVGVVLVAAVALASASTVRPPAPTDTTQATP